MRFNEIILEVTANRIKTLLNNRYTIKQLTQQLVSAGFRDDVALEPTEVEPNNGDICYNINLGCVTTKHGIIQYLDYEIYLLETNIKGIYLVTEINAF